MTQTLSPPDACLVSLLADGPRNSREVLAAMVDQQFTPKQVRRARERHCIVIERAGNGSAMHSTWRLPDRAPDGIATPKPCADIDPETPPDDADMRHAPAAHHDAPPDAPPMTEGERRRHSARVQAFMARSIDAPTARRVAGALVARDRAGQREWGSCAECQNIELRQCPATPRPVIEVHLCWARRTCTP